MQDVLFRLTSGHRSLLGLRRRKSLSSLYVRVLTVVAVFAGALGLVAASPLESGIGTRTMSSGSLVIVDKADSSAEHETGPQPASVSQTAGEIPQEIEVCFPSCGDCLRAPQPVQGL